MLLVALQVIGEPEQVITVAPIITRSFVEGNVIGVAQVADPEGTVIVSPLTAAVTQLFTSVREAEAATRLGLEPPHTAQAGHAKRKRINNRFTLKPRDELVEISALLLWRGGVVVL